MSRPQTEPRALNHLLDAAFATLSELGNDTYAALLKDQLDPRTFVEFLRRTAHRHPAVYREVLGALGPRAVARWGVGLARTWWST